MEAINLENCSSKEIKEFLDSFDTVLCDCDGVVKLVDNLLPDIPEAIKYLKDIGKTVKFITNNCISSRKEWGELFSNMDVTYDDIISPIKAIIEHLNKIKFDKNKKLFVFGSPAMIEEFEKEGYSIYKYKEEGNIVKFSDILKYMTDDLSVGAVIVEIDVHFTFQKIIKASVISKRPDVHLIYGGTDKICPIDGDNKIIGPYFLQSMLNEMIKNTSKEAVILAKPSKMFQKYLHNQFLYDPKRTLFIGDSMSSDMTFAAGCGYQKMIVLTGITKLEDLASFPNFLKPQYYLESLGKLPTIARKK